MENAEQKSDEMKAKEIREALERTRRENTERLRTQIERQQALIEALTRLRANDYVPWQSAGGPNECLHGRAKGIACPLCDRNTELDALGKKVVASEWETSAHALEMAVSHREWIRQRVEAWAVANLVSDKTVAAFRMMRGSPNWDAFTLEFGSAHEVVWRSAEALYEEGRKLGFLP